MAQRIIDDDKLRSYSRLYRVEDGPWEGKRVRLSTTFIDSLVMTINGERGFYKLGTVCKGWSIKWSKV